MISIGAELERDIFAEFAEFRNVPEPWYYQKWMICSFVLCLVIHHVISPLIFTRHNKAYRALPRDKRMEWDSRFVSSIHATIVSILCLTSLFKDRQLWAQPIFATSHVGLVALSISVGYFLCDLFSMPLYWWNAQLLIFILHHIAAAYAFFNVVGYRSCVFFGVYRLTTELSTPFVNQRWFYRTIGYKPDRRRVASVALMFAILFAITRNLMILPFWFISYQAYHSRAHEICVKHIPWIDFSFTACCLVLDVLNIYWAPTTYCIGIRAMKFLRTANWADDIQLARMRLRKRLHHFRHRIRSESINQQQNTVLPNPSSSLADSIQNGDQPMVSASSSEYSSDTECEFADLYIYDDVTPNLHSPDSNNVNSIPGKSFDRNMDDTLIQHRSVNSR